MLYGNLYKGMFSAVQGGQVSLVPKCDRHIQEYWKTGNECLNTMFDLDLTLTELRYLTRAPRLYQYKQPIV